MAPNISHYQNNSYNETMSLHQMYLPMCCSSDSNAALPFLHIVLTLQLAAQGS